MKRAARNRPPQFRPHRPVQITAPPAAPTSAADVRLVCFNGLTAADLYQRHVVRTLTEGQRTIAKRTLPSTSGAHARLTLAQKVAQWSILWTPHLDR
jgi:G:T/U-mismatch repair DNA glycosylase